MGFTTSDADPALFTRNDKTGRILMLVYVDDILISAPTVEAIERVKARLTEAFKARDLGEANYYLGINITRDRAAKTIKLSHTRMINDLISKYDLSECRPRDTPISVGTVLSKTDGEPLNRDIYPYATLVGALLYLSITTRPDIAFVVGRLSCFMSNPTTTHWTVAKGVLRYLATNADMGITFSGSGTTIIGYCDADYAADVDTRRSTTGYVFLLNGGAITWCSKRQPTVAASTTEAEYITAGAACREALWLRKLSADFGLTIGTIGIGSDNQGAIKLLRNPVSSMRSKHIDIVHHFARERVARGEVIYHYVNTNSMVADALTKPLPVTKFITCRTGMGMQ